MHIHLGPMHIHILILVFFQISMNVMLNGQTVTSKQIASTQRVHMSVAVRMELQEMGPRAQVENLAMSIF